MLKKTKQIAAQTFGGAIREKYFQSFKSARRRNNEQNYKESLVIAYWNNVIVKITYIYTPLQKQKVSSYNLIIWTNIQKQWLNQSPTVSRSMNCSTRSSRIKLTEKQGIFPLI